MTLGVLMIDLDGTELSAEEMELLRHPLVCGAILFARNFDNPEQLAALTASIRGLRDPQLLIAVDQEGGRVQRFRTGFTELPAAAVFGECYDSDPDDALESARDAGWLLATELHAVGIDFSFAPVLDLRKADGRVIGDRAFHADPQVVSRLAQAFVGGARTAGIAAVGKHFPGHGSVAEDSHVELPIDERDIHDFHQSDLIPFHAMIRVGIEAMMAAHLLVPSVDSAPAAYSSRWIGTVLRREMGFDGVVFSDDLAMAGAASAGPYAARARRALQAGCDVLLLCNQRRGVCEVLDGLEESPQPLAQVRLMRLHARGEQLPMLELQAATRWRLASERMSRYCRNLELDLGDDNLL